MYSCTSTTYSYSKTLSSECKLVVFVCLYFSLKKSGVFEIFCMVGSLICYLNLNRNMKINDKNLSYFASSATPVDKEGWLVKRGEINKAYQKRWFVLKGNLLFYFEKKGDKEPVGLVVLEGCTIGEKFQTQNKF